MSIDMTALGQRIAEARGRAGRTQVELASAISMDRSALAKIESGTRRVTALELARIADAVNARIEWFLEDAPPAIVSRRNTQEPGAPSPRIDMMVERITREVELLARYDTRFVLGVSPEREMPTDAAAAETLAGEARGFMGVDGDGPCTQLADKVAAIGLLVFSFDLGVESADAATILLRSGGVSVVN
ncbi:MAG TPA: helix-turn-helix transcriptional regulator, partial [Pseudonocardiaceae bacterium]|nr:helix-turn-helix transcriptional regulator [Pseudonocardiaceae bacterium]